ncbi:MAG TPA: hypothetical protein VH330_11920 [Candidatus Udaeobacter sp.]|jgi:hypothetical protein
MRTVSSTLAVFLATTLMVENATAKQPTIVYPTGTFPIDVQNVQAAIDKGGTVLLKATDKNRHRLAFNFGPAEPLPNNYVYISRDVSIIGETVGSSRSTIHGGYAPVYGSPTYPARASIEGIRFDGPLLDAIFIQGSQGLRIVGNEIVNVVPYDNGVFTTADGIDIYPRTLSATDITGSLVITGNVIGDLTGDFSIGIQLDIIGANVEISNNFLKIGQTVAGDPGEVQSNGIAGARCHKTVLIFGNTVIIGPGTVFSGIAISGDSDAHYRVIGNFIDSQSPGSDGISAVNSVDANGGIDSAVISYNWMNLHQTLYNGIDIIGGFSQGAIQGNVILGNAGAAFACFSLYPGDPGDRAAGNHFLFNDISHLTAAFASIYFDVNTFHNLVVGQCGSTDIDLGVGNQFQCFDRPH